MALSLSEMAQYNRPKSLSEIAREQEEAHDNEMRRKLMGGSSEPGVVNIYNNYGNGVQIGTVNGELHTNGSAESSEESEGKQ